MPIPANTSIRSPNYHGDPGRRVRFVVIHQTMGVFSSDVNILCNNTVPIANRVSTHYLIDRDGTVYELVRPEHVAWHAGAKAINKKNGTFRQFMGFGDENRHSIGIEITARENQAFTNAQRKACARLVAQIVREFPDVLVDRNHMLAHSEISKAKKDPQLSVPGNPNNWNWDEFMQSVRQELTGTGPVITSTPLEPRPEGVVSVGGSWFFTQTNQYLTLGFLDLWRTLGNGMFVCGFPLTQELNEDGLTVQYFENVRMEWRPGMQPRFGAVGRQYVEQAGVGPGADSTDNPRNFPETGHSVGGTFRALLDQKGLATCGFPLTGELAEDSLTVQYFENVRMERSDTVQARFGAVGRQFLEHIHLDTLD